MDCAYRGAVCAFRICVSGRACKEWLELVQAMLVMSRAKASRCLSLPKVEGLVRSMVGQQMALYVLETASFGTGLSTSTPDDSMPMASRKGISLINS